MLPQRAAVGQSIVVNSRETTAAARARRPGISVTVRISGAAVSGRAELPYSASGRDPADLDPRAGCHRADVVSGAVGRDPGAGAARGGRHGLVADPRAPVARDRAADDPRGLPAPAALRRRLGSVVDRFPALAAADPAARHPGAGPPDP